MDFGLSFHCGANQSTTAACCAHRHLVTKASVCRMQREAGSGDCGPGSGCSSQGTKGLSGWCQGLSPVVWYQPVPGQQHQCTAQLCLCFVPALNHPWWMCRPLFSSARAEREFSGPGNDCSPPPSTQDTQLGHSTNGRWLEGLQRVQFRGQPVLPTTTPSTLQWQPEQDTHPSYGRIPVTSSRCPLAPLPHLCVPISSCSIPCCPIGHPPTPPDCTKSAQETCS